MSDAVIKMPQRFDYNANREFHNQLQQILESSNKQDRKVVLDCTDLEYIDSTGIGILIMAHKNAQNQGADLSIKNIKATAKEILYLANIQKLIEMT